MNISSSHYKPIKKDFKYTFHIFRILLFIMFLDVLVNDLIPLTGFELVTKNSQLRLDRSLTEKNVSRNQPEIISPVELHFPVTEFSRNGDLK